MVSVLSRKHEWTLGDESNENFKSCSYHGQTSSCEEKDFSQQHGDDLHKKSSFSEKWVS